MITLSLLIGYKIGASTTRDQNKIRDSNSLVSDLDQFLYVRRSIAISSTKEDEQQVNIFKTTKLIITSNEIHPRRTDPKITSILRSLRSQGLPPKPFSISTKAYSLLVNCTVALSISIKRI